MAFFPPPHPLLLLRNAEKARLLTDCAALYLCFFQIEIDVPRTNPAVGIFNQRTVQEVRAATVAPRGRLFAALCFF
jgi:hypothetical protein